MSNIFRTLKYPLKISNSRTFSFQRSVPAVTTTYLLFVEGGVISLRGRHARGVISFQTLRKLIIG